MSVALSVFQQCSSKACRTGQTDMLQSLVACMLRHGSGLGKPQAAYSMRHMLDWCCTLVACTIAAQTKVANNRHGSVVALALLCLLIAAVGLASQLESEAVVWVQCSTPAAGGVAHSTGCWVHVAARLCILYLGLGRSFCAPWIRTDARGQAYPLHSTVDRADHPLC
jgi:hypothetical protein